MKERRRSILHVDLDPFFVSVERSADPSLRDRPVIVGGDGHGLGFVAAVSDEARAAGISVGMALARARALQPEAAFRRGDLEAYGRVSDEVTTVLLAASRRVERPSADEAFVDLTPDSAGDLPPVRATETIRDELQRRLGLDVSLGLASSRLAARIASSWARPRGLLVVLPGYELSFISGKPVSVLGLPPHLDAALEKHGLTTLGAVADCDEARLVAAIGGAAARVRAVARNEGEPPIAVAAPPVSVQEEAAIRDRRSDATIVQQVAFGLGRRAARRLKPFRLAAGAISIEVRHAADTVRRAQMLQPAVSDEEVLAALVRSLVTPLLDSAEGVRSLLVRLTRLTGASSQAPLFPASPALRHA